ncbi:MAG: SDR family oxidoreductase [Myxococcales bacterium]|nr:SDR family oxidoreductase [Myxococcales bacterium]
MKGKVCVVTGANSGVGRAMAAQLAELGAHVVMVCRSEERGREALEAVRKATAGQVELVIGDLSQMSQVREVAREVAGLHPSVHVLLNNAGIYLPKRQLTPEGLEVMFAVNHLAPFVLTQELLGALRKGAPSRVITTSSAGHRLGHLDFTDLQCERSFGGIQQYAATKLANILFTRELARRGKAEGIVAHAFHPGGVASGFAQDEPGLFGTLMWLGRPFLRSAERAARTGTFLASSEEAGNSTGEYWADSRRKKPSREAGDDAVAARLWEVSLELAASRRSG